MADFIPTALKDPEISKKFDKLSLSRDQYDYQCYLLLSRIDAEGIADREMAEEVRDTLHNRRVINDEMLKLISGQVH